MIAPALDWLGLYACKRAVKLLNEIGPYKIIVKSPWGKLEVTFHLEVSLRSS
jgi:hypothetical protein